MAALNAVMSDYLRPVVVCNLSVRLEKLLCKYAPYAEPNLRGREVLSKQ